MKKRLLTGIPAAAIVIGLVYSHQPTLVLSVMIALGVIAYREYDRLFFEPHRPRQLKMALLLTLCLLALRVNLEIGWLAYWMCFTALTITHLVYRNRLGYLTGSAREFALECLALTYIPALLGFIVPIMELHPHGDHFLMLLLFIVFFGDTSAYFVGRRWGKHSLASNLSPKKTIEGAVASVAGVLLTAVFWLTCLYPEPTSTQFKLQILLIAAVGNGLAQCGDLLESLLKRSQQQKDSGSFMPGHGGILDRIDGLALAAPMYYVYLVYVLGFGKPA